MTREQALGIMQLSEGYSEDDLRKTYRKLAKKAHPDAGGSAEQFMLIKEAYEYLNNPANNKRLKVTHSGILDVVII